MQKKKWTSYQILESNNLIQFSCRCAPKFANQIHSWVRSNWVNKWLLWFTFRWLVRKKWYELFLNQTEKSSKLHFNLFRPHLNFSPFSSLGLQWTHFLLLSVLRSIFICQNVKSQSSGNCPLQVALSYTIMLSPDSDRSSPSITLKMNTKWSPLSSLSQRKQPSLFLAFKTNQM